MNGRGFALFRMVMLNKWDVLNHGARCTDCYYWYLGMRSRIGGNL